MSKSIYFLWQAAVCLLLLFAGCSPETKQASSSATAKVVPFELQEATISEIHQAFREGTCNCQQLVAAYLERIEKYDQPTKLNAIVVTNPEAMARARQLDEEFASTRRLQPLHCIPVIVKDNYNTAGLQTAAGSLAMKGYKPATDAYQVQELKEAGAIVLAKSNMAEWAFSPMVSISSIAGETLNPYNLEHVPAGSSGGTAAAVAANFGTVGLGTDTGNSIRGPSSHNALVGFRTTMGLTSRAGIVPLYLRNDVGGPMARTVEDATRVLEVIAGYDPADPLTQHSQGKVPQNYQQYLDKDGLKGARIGVLRILSDKNPDPQVKALFEQAIADLKALGAEVVDVSVPDFDALSKDQWCDVFQADLNAYLAAQGESVPVKNLDEVVASGKYAPYIEENLKYFQQNQFTAEAGSNACGDAYTDPKRIAFREAVEKAMDKYNVGALIYPTWNNPPAKAGDFEGYKGDNSQIIAPHTGQPAFTVPMGFTYENLPAGLQFLGRMYDEPTLIKYTYSYEQGTRHRKPPVKFSK
ncbi:amidase family protein [Pontibacter akesuensis]|uniref:Asp-tRNAAsn/Glu-tRNAGln amidotransferase A subunit n=1 Tax=Pontibacter akesuensis TaxID=388950 RepID=A0A1I7GUX2_9BACT|nr:amidase family protein [Pontibacter akesuensis]GHA54932.1 amidase [Pontibacter akesuensis]SFU52240.1 Asp-tRNAAsn/Glu-tRNAGln amidotransferase A subunit [Pontibacter akesuensis]